MILRDPRSAKFHAAFTEPFASHRWGSLRAKRHWYHLELLQDKLAGPLSGGSCRWVYSRDDQYFHGVTDPESLRTRLLEWHAQLAAEVAKFKPQTSRQRVDFAYMNSRLEIMRELIDDVIATELRGYRL